MFDFPGNYSWADLCWIGFSLLHRGMHKGGFPAGVFLGAWMTHITRQRHYFLFIYAILLTTSGLLIIKAFYAGP